MALVGFAGLVYYIDVHAAMSVVGNEAFGQILNYDFAVLPLFILMGNFIAQSRISNDLYDASNAWVGHTRGGLATATLLTLLVVPTFYTIFDDLRLIMAAAISPKRAAHETQEAVAGSTEAPATT